MKAHVFMVILALQIKEKGKCVSSDLKWEKPGELAFHLRRGQISEVSRSILEELIACNGVCKVDQRIDEAV